MLNASDDGEPQAEKNGFDWRLVGLGALGIGAIGAMIYAASKIDLSSDKSNVNVCSGAGCRPPANNKPPPEPKRKGDRKEN